MTLALQDQAVTTEQLLALPDDGKERWLVRGKLREPDTRRRYRLHDRVQANLCFALRQWSSRQVPDGKVLLGEVGFRLRRDPDTTMGADVAYVEGSISSDGSIDFALDAVPVLAVRILSPSDTRGAINDRVKGLVDAGVELVWNVEVLHRTITVYRADAEPELFNATQSISADPHLPGFNVAVADVFSR
jgi:Uma2 family endonuclease